MKGLVGAAQANVRAEEESMDPVKLIASDGTEVILDRRAAMVSGTIKAMLAGPGASAAPSLLLSRRGLTLLCQPRRQFHRGAAGRDQVPGDLGAHPREGPLTHAFLRERPFGHRQLLSFPLAPAIAPTLGPPPSPASLLSALPQWCAWSCLSSLGTFVADGAVLLLQAALHESPGHASRVQDRAGERVGAADGR